MQEKKPYLSDKENSRIGSGMNIKKRKLPEAEDLVHGVLGNNRTLLSKAITMLESNREDHKVIAREIVSKCLPHSGKSIRMGITGVPGAGKSTFIEALGSHIIEKGKKLAVLAIDPSSLKSGGSILGDKTRMEKLSGDENAFIRPSPTSGSLGGVAKATRESIILCEAAGYDVIFVETVGVGQSEIAVSWLVDFFLLLMIPGAGDELQGIKRGIMEMADAIVINKADGDNVKRAKDAAQQIKNALHLLPPVEKDWRTKVTTCSALMNTGIEAIWDVVEDYETKMKQKGHFDLKRREQATYWMHQTIERSLKEQFYANEKVQAHLKETELEVAAGKYSPFAAAEKLMRLYFEGE